MRPEIRIFRDRYPPPLSLHRRTRGRRTPPNGPRSTLRRKPKARSYSIPAWSASPSTAAIARAFEKKYGITAEFLDLRISEIRERMRAEQIAGRVIGDVLTTSYNVTTSIEMNEGYIQPLKPFPARRACAGSKIDNPIGHAGAGLHAEVRHPGQHAAGDAGRRAEKLGRSRRSEMDRQDSRRRSARARRRLQCLRRAARQARRGFPEKARRPEADLLARSARIRTPHRARRIPGLCAVPVQRLFDACADCRSRRSRRQKASPTCSSSPR